MCAMAPAHSKASTHSILTGNTSGSCRKCGFGHGSHEASYGRCSKCSKCSICCTRAPKCYASVDSEDEDGEQAAASSKIGPTKRALEVSDRIVKCKNGHKLVEVPKGSSKSPSCDGIGCGKKSIAKDGPYFCCKKCDFDLCQPCHSKELKKLSERPFECRLSHPMARLAESISQLQELMVLEKKKGKVAGVGSDIGKSESAAADSLHEYVEEEAVDDAIYDDDDDDADDTHDTSSTTGPSGAVSASIPDDFELKKNEAAAELYFIKYSPVGPELDGFEGPEGGLLVVPDEQSDGSIGLTRQNSAGFYSLHQYSPIKKIADLISFTDKNGNGAAHHAASIGLRRTVEALFTVGAKKWIMNSFSDSPTGLLDGLPMFAGEDRNTLYRAVAKHGLLDPVLVQCALRIPRPYVEPAVFSKLIECIHGGSDNDDYDGAYYADQHVKDNVPQAKLYRALFYLLKGYGTIAASEDIRSYLQEVLAGGPHVFSPLYFYARFLLWKMVVGKPSHAKRDKLLASGMYICTLHYIILFVSTFIQFALHTDALIALRCFPEVASAWLDPKEKHDKEVAEAGIDCDEPPPEVDEDDYSDLIPPPGPDDPETAWDKAKRDYSLTSESMDTLMKLVGLREIKERAIAVALTVLLDPPADLKTGTSMVS